MNFSVNDKTKKKAIGDISEKIKKVVASEDKFILGVSDFKILILNLNNTNEVKNNLSELESMKTNCNEYLANVK